MKFFRQLSFIILLIATLGILALSLFALTFDSNDYKSKIADLVSKQTGRDINLVGDLELSIFPNIAIKTGKASIGNAAGFNDKPFASFNSADISVKFLPLLQKKLKVNSVILYGLNLNLHRNSKGKNNWDDLASGSSPKQEDKKSDFSEVVGEMIAGLTVAGVSIKNSQIHWRDDTTGQKIDLSPLSLKTGAYKANRPISIELSTRLKQNSPAMALTLEASTELKLDKNKQTFSLKDLKLNTHLTGSMAKGGAIDSKLTGDVSGNTQSVHIPNLKLNTTITGDSIPNGKITAKLSGNTRFKPQKQQLSISNMALDSSITGKPLQGGTLTAHINSATNFNLKTQQLALTGMQGDIQLQGGVLAGGKLLAKVVGNTQLNLQQSSANINKLKLSSTLTSPQIPAGKLEQNASGSVTLNWAKHTGQADLNTLAITLANLQLTGSGKINQLMTSPEIQGNFKTNAFALSQLLKTLGMAPHTTRKAGLLGQTQMNFSLLASPEQVQLSNLAMTLDDSKIAGQFSIRNFSKPIIQSKLTIDRLNVDNYLSPETNKKESNSAADALLPLAAMRNLNMDASLSVGSMVYSKIKMSHAKVQLTAKNGLVKADPISATLYKGTYTGNIHLDTAKPVPSISMQHKLRDLRSEGLLFDLFDDKLVTGAANFTADIKTSGNSVADIKRNLFGTIDVVFRDGTIRDSKFAQKVAIAVQAFEKKETDGTGKSKVKFTKLSGDWTAKKGIFTTDNMAMKAPQFDIEGKGDVNIVKDDLDFRLNIGRKKQKDQRNIFIPLRIYGAFGNIKYQLRLDDLIKQLAKEDLEKEKQKARERLEKEKAKLTKQLEQRRDEERQKLQDRLDKEKKRLENQAIQERDKLNKRLKDEVGDKLKKQLENKLKGLF